MNDGWERTERGWRKVYKVHSSPGDARSDLACPRFISDTMPATEHLDGKFYDSKSQYRAVTKAHGCIEIGTEKLKRIERPKPDAKKRREAVQKAVAQVLG